MALRGLSTLNTLRIFTTEMALDLDTTHTQPITKHLPGETTLSEGTIHFYVTPSSQIQCPRDYLLHAHGEEGYADNHQVQDVKGVPAEGASV